MAAQLSLCPLSEADLQLSRRVDWRFLLPDPKLGKVAYLGQRNAPVLKALERFSESVHVISEDDVSNYRCTIDLLFGTDVSRQTIEWSSVVLKPGGCIYIECTRRFRGGGQKQLGEGWSFRSVADHITALSAMGFDDVRGYWHFPNFEECRQIIPLMDEPTGWFAWLRSRNDFIAKFKSLGGEYMERTGLLRHVVAHFSIVGRKGSHRR